MNSQITSFLDKIKKSTGSYTLQRAIYRSCPYSVSKIKEALCKPFDKEAVAAKTFTLHFDDPDSEYYHMSVEDIIAKWEAKGEFGRNNGKALDKYVELLVEKKEAPEILEKYISSLNEVAGNKCKQYNQFYHNNLEHKYEFVGREIMLHDTSLKVNGRLDALFLVPTGDTLILFDWKNDKKISVENQYEKLKGPLYEYDASDLNKYTIQLYIYVYILRNVYHLDNFKIVPLVVRFGENDFGIYSPMIPYSDQLVRDIIEYAKTQINI